MSVNVNFNYNTGRVGNKNEGTRRTSNDQGGGTRNESIFNQPRPSTGRTAQANPFGGKSFDKYAYDHHFGEINGKNYGHKRMNESTAREKTNFEQNVKNETAKKKATLGGILGGVIGFMVLGPVGAALGAFAGAKIGKNSVS